MNLEASPAAKTFTEKIVAMTEEPYSSVSAKLQQMFLCPLPTETSTLEINASHDPWENQINLTVYALDKDGQALEWPPFGRYFHLVTLPGPILPDDLPSLWVGSSKETLLRENPDHYEYFTFEHACRTMVEELRHYWLKSGGLSLSVPTLITGDYLGLLCNFNLKTGQWQE